MIPTSLPPRFLARAGSVANNDLGLFPNTLSRDERDGCTQQRECKEARGSSRRCRRRKRAARSSRARAALALFLRPSSVRPSPLLDAVSHTQDYTQARLKSLFFSHTRTPATAVRADRGCVTLQKRPSHTPPPETFAPALPPRPRILSSQQAAAGSRHTQCRWSWDAARLSPAAEGGSSGGLADRAAGAAFWRAPGPSQSRRALRWPATGSRRARARTSRRWRKRSEVGRIDDWAACGEKKRCSFSDSPTLPPLLFLQLAAPTPNAICRGRARRVREAQAAAGSGGEEAGRAAGQMGTKAGG